MAQSQQVWAISLGPYVKLTTPSLAEQQGKCARCWHCCITTCSDGVIDWAKFYGLFELPLHWVRLQMENPTVHICPFLTVNGEGEPHCLIYAERPEMCKGTVCKWMSK